MTSQARQNVLELKFNCISKILRCLLKNLNNLTNEFHSQFVTCANVLNHSIPCVHRCVEFKCPCKAKCKMSSTMAEVLMNLVNIYCFQLKYQHHNGSVSTSNPDYLLFLFVDMILINLFLITK